MKNKGEFIEPDKRPEVLEQQDRRGIDESAVKPSTPAHPEEPIIMFPRPADERAGIFLKEWMRRFTRM